MRTLTAKSIILTTIVLSAAVAQAHVETGSFLNKRARTVNELVYETEHDHLVQDRYMRHFRMSEPDLVAYFERLHVSKLDTTGSYVMYNCHDDEVIRARVFRMKAGTPVFADETGKPILKASCGNPLVAPTPRVIVNTVIKEKVVNHYITTPAPTPTPVPPTIIMPPAPPAPAPVPPAAPVINNNYSTGGAVTTNKSSYASSLFILPVVLLFNNHGSSCNVKKQPTPEPASMLVMGFGATALMIRRKKKNPKV